MYLQDTKKNNIEDTMHGCLQPRIMVGLANNDGCNIEH